MLDDVPNRSKIPGVGTFSLSFAWITMDSQDGLKTIALPLFLNIFYFLFPPAAALCHDFSLDDSVET